MSAAPADSCTPVLAENKNDDVQKALATTTTANSDSRPVEASRLEPLPRELRELIYFYAGYLVADRCIHSCEKKCRAFLDYERTSKIVSRCVERFRATPHVLEVNKGCAHPEARQWKVEGVEVDGDRRPAKAHPSPIRLGAAFSVQGFLLIVGTNDMSSNDEVEVFEGSSCAKPLPFDLTRARFPMKPSKRQLAATWLSSSHPRDSERLIPHCAHKQPIRYNLSILPLTLVSRPPTP
ncbi:hypothetical protein BU23DRAFT_571507 [Bimuria novae-zelandiae CBS 107.79]|uniref:Uncharacterized protein n=1 Tax=Bimuria novae-zelandiae CBS 107.79 TaxID=1447943 RepID=A0A6A5UY68_9PLEO|nr:hypothetical protein BU23DRAFT_571507 [Bimuria novae-zelandiae CBS 107.79]